MYLNENKNTMKYLWS